MMKELDYRWVLEMAPYAYAEHKIVYDDKNRPCDYIFLDVNQTFEKITGFKRDLILGKKATEVMPGVRGKSFDWVEFFGTHGASGDKKEFHQYSEPLKCWYKGNVVYPEPGRFLTYFYDASSETDRVEAYRTLVESKAGEQTNRLKENEAKLLEALNEKDIMIMEIHHRVKNNLQVISSLLYLQSSYIENEHVNKILQDSQNRIQAMALLHEKIYQSDNFNKIDMPEYLESISRQIMSYYTYTTGNIELQVHVADLDISIEKAIICGLMVNELVTNSLQHAFVNRDSGLIRIDMQSREPDFVWLSVKDNGLGFPDGFDPHNTESLGLQLVINLAEQLNGEFRCVNDDEGAVVEIQFPIINKE